MILIYIPPPPFLRHFLISGSQYLLQRFHFSPRSSTFGHVQCFLSTSALVILLILCKNCPECFLCLACNNLHIWFLIHGLCWADSASWDSHSWPQSTGVVPHPPAREQSFYWVFKDRFLWWPGRGKVVWPVSLMDGLWVSGFSKIHQLLTFFCPECSPVCLRGTAALLWRPTHFQVSMSLWRALWSPKWACARQEAIS